MLNQKAFSQILAVPKPTDCAPVVSSVTVVSEDQYKETDVVAPYKEISTSPLHPTSCQSTEEGWERCKSLDTGKIESFKLTNKGPNNIIKTNDSNNNREMSFEFEDFARSDLKLVVVDVPDEITSHATYSIMLFFPRSVMPAIKKVGNVLEVTLPNKEIVHYNAATHEIIDGVLTEGPMATDPKNRNKALPANIKYTGNGVLIRSDKTGDLPYGDIETSTGGFAPSISVATVSKKGFRDCKIPSKDIWFTDRGKKNAAFIKPELANDNGMDLLIKNKCGFSLY